MLDVVTFHSQPISFNALLSILLKFLTDLEGILAKNILRKKVPNCTKFKTPFKNLCFGFANMKNWRSDQVLSWRSENLYSTYET
jgi:hypothetical protein